MYKGFLKKIYGTFHFLFYCCVDMFMCMYVAQISMISVMRWTAQVPIVLSLTVAVYLELRWDQTDKHAWVRQTQREEERGQISCAKDKDKQENVEDG